jgi:hypothetical protein
MARPKQIVKRIEVEVAVRRRTCKFTRTDIAKGALCLVVFDGPRDRKTYCVEVGRLMIQNARKRLVELERELGLVQS